MGDINEELSVNEDFSNVNKSFGEFIIVIEYYKYYLKIVKEE